MTPAQLVRLRAKRIMRRIQRDDEDVIQQRREDLLADLRRHHKRRKRDRIMREAADQSDGR